MDDYDLFKQRMAALSGAIFLFGLAGLFLADAFFPAILPLIFVASIPALIAEQGWRYGLWIILQMAIWLGGLPLLFTLDMVFPGVLMLAGLSALLVAIVPPDRLDQQHQAWVAEQRTLGAEKAKRKRTGRAFPLPPVDATLDILDDDDDFDEVLYAESASDAVDSSTGHFS